MSLSATPLPLLALGPVGRSALSGAVHPSLRSVTKGLVAVGFILLGLGLTTWHPNNTTLLVPLDGEVRVQFQFRNDPP